MFRTRLIVVCAALSMVSVSKAQEFETTRDLVPDKAIKLSMMHFLDVFPTVQVAYEHRVIGSTTVQAELGYVIENNFFPDLKDKNGFKSKIEVRHYVSSIPHRNKGYYGAFEVYNNAVDYKREDWREECFDNDCTSRFTRRYRYPVEYREYGFALKFGVIHYISDFFFDVNSGWAFRIIDYTKPRLPGEFGEDGFGFEIPNETDRRVPSPVIGFRVGYRIQ